MREHPLYIQCEEKQLFSVVYEPERKSLNEKSVGYIMLHPFAEEKKCAQRVIVELARALQRTGACVLVFDFSGCGESEGELSQARLEDWIDETKSMVHFLTEKHGVEEVQLLGVRLGAYIAAMACYDQPDVSRIILLEPILNPAKYLIKALKTKLVQELLTDGAVRSNREELVNELNSGSGIDFGGYLISPAFYQSLQRMEDEAFPYIPKRLLIVNVSSSGRSTRSFLRIKDRLSNHTDQLVSKTIRFEEFWLLSEPGFSSDFIDELLLAFTENKVHANIP